MNSRRYDSNRRGISYLYDVNKYKATSGNRCELVPVSCCKHPPTGRARFAKLDEDKLWYRFIPKYWTVSGRSQPLEYACRARSMFRVSFRSNKNPDKHCTLNLDQRNRALKKTGLRTKNSLSCRGSHLQVQVMFSGSPVIFMPSHIFHAS